MTDDEPDPSTDDRWTEPAEREAPPTFPREPYALFPSGGYVGPEGFDFLIHKEISNEAQCVLLFESIVDAFTVAEDYKKATGKEAEPRPLEVRGIEDRFWVKFYRASGDIVVCPLRDYLEYME